MTIKMLTRLSTYDLNQPALMCIDNIELPAGSAREKGHLIRGRARAARMAPFGYLKAVHHPSLHVRNQNTMLTRRRVGGTDEAALSRLCQQPGGE